jgi:predicted Abi (CAAX) family protease
MRFPSSFLLLTPGTRTQWRQRWRYGLMMLLVTLLIRMGGSEALWAQSSPGVPSPKDLAPFNQVDFFLIDAPQPETLYRPVGEWAGRLILPSVEEFQAQYQATQENDWAWFEVIHAPADHADLQGQILRLAWLDQPAVQAYVRAATTDMRFTPDVAPSMARGNVHPQRLDGRDQVGPLQSLAGYRPQDDMTVVLRGTVQVDNSGTTPTLRLQQEPVQETGYYYALVRFEEPVPPPPGYDLPPICPDPCTSEFFRVRHYNAVTGAFDGEEAILRVPQQPPGSNEVLSSTPNDLHRSPVGTAGWYVYGALDQAGTFTVQALKPRSLFQMEPTDRVAGAAPAFRYIRTLNWQDTPNRKGTAQSVWVTPEIGSETEEEGAIASWPVGTRLLVMHLFGARGGDPPYGEQSFLGTYTGHFSYGLGEVVQEPLAQEPQLQITYLQIYANNPEGITAGSHTWANYMGNLQRGWMGTRPVSDGVIQLDALTEDYQFDDHQFSIFNEFLVQQSLVAARYRTGDGSGSAFVTAATSCVQDANQALYNTIRRIQVGVETHPEAVDWMRAHPQDPNTLRFQQLEKLGRDLYTQLTPLGRVRWDWDANANIVTGTQPPTGFTSLDQLTLRNTLTGLLSWRTALPRQAHDEIATLFFRNGGTLWFLRTNQIGGHDPNIYPIAPTFPLGAYTLPFTEIPLLTLLLTRTLASLRVPHGFGWGITILGLAGFGAIALFVGSHSGFLRWRPWAAAIHAKLLLLLKLLIFPALTEEWFFRVLLLPEPGRTSISEPVWWLVALLVLGLFVVYHPLNAKFTYKVAQPTFYDPVFLSLTAILGFTCTLIYRLTGSLWTITFLHWIAVGVWLLFLGGIQRLLPSPAQANSHRVSTPSQAP